MITGIIMAAGYSRRMERDKLIMDFKGKAMVEWVIKAAVESQLDQVILVYRREDVKRIGEKYKVKTVYNPRAHLGQAESIKAGVKSALDPTNYMFLVGDMPYIDRALIDRLIRAYDRKPGSIQVPFYGGRQGMPTIFSSIYREDLLSIEGDKGGRDIIKKNRNLVSQVNISNPKLGIDIDSMEDVKNTKLDLGE